jgi:hypothetical protein
MNNSLGSSDPSFFDIDGVDDLDVLETKDSTLDILESDDPDLTRVIKEYWEDIQQEVADHPVMRLYVAGLYKMAGEYTRIEKQIKDLSDDVDALGLAPALTNERARIRDNMTSLTTEGWKLLNAVLDSLHKIQSMLTKLKLTDSSDEDPFESFMSGG